MNRTILLLLLVVTVILSPSCKKISGKGDVVSTKRDVTGYTGIDSRTEGTVYYTPDSVWSLEIQAQQNIADVIETYVDGGKLIIRIKNHTVLGHHDPIKIYITAPHVSYFHVSGSSAFHLQNTIEEYIVECSISGSGDIHGNTILANSLKCKISGSGNITVASGTSDYGDLNISGSGNIDLAGMVSDSVYASISGSGDIKVNAQKYLEGTISGSGDIRYLGTPVIVAHISGSGSIKPM